MVDSDTIDPRANPNDCKNIIAKEFAIEKANLAKIRDKYGEFLSKDLPEKDIWKTPGAKSVIKLTE